jgi:hypothetical protein
LEEIKKRVLPLGRAPVSSRSRPNPFDGAGLVTKLTQGNPRDGCFETLLYLMMLMRPLFRLLQFMKGSINVFHGLHPMTAPFPAGMLELTFCVSQGLFRAIHFSRLIFSLE